MKKTEELEIQSFYCENFVVDPMLSNDEKCNIQCNYCKHIINL